MALIPVDDDTWLREAESCERLCIEINAQIAERNREAVTSERYQQLSAAIRVRLNQLNSQTKEVRLKLGVTKENLTDEERERRLRQVEVLESKRIRLQTEFQDLASVRQNDRDQLLVGGNGATTATSSRGGGGVLGGQTVDLLQVQHKQIIQEQDEGLENLAKIISRQKDIAIRIHEEVQNQNELLDEIGDGMENVDTRINEEIIHVRQVARKPSLCGYYLLIIGLLIVLFLVLWLR